MLYLSAMTKEFIVPSWSPGKATAATLSYTRPYRSSRPRIWFYPSRPLPHMWAKNQCFPFSKENYLIGKKNWLSRICSLELHRPVQKIILRRRRRRKQACGKKVSGADISVNPILRNIFRNLFKSQGRWILLSGWKERYPSILPC